MNEPQKKYLTTRERICFTVGAFGRSGIYTLMSMFTLVFFQNGAGLSLSQGTTIILIGRIFDALNDPVMGMIVDRTKSKWGKMRPYLLFAPVPIAICTILLFTAPFKEDSTAAFVWALITYILWGVAFTVQDVPFWWPVLCDYPCWKVSVLPLFPPPAWAPPSAAFCRRCWCPFCTRATWAITKVSL